MTAAAGGTLGRFLLLLIVASALGCAGPDTWLKRRWLDVQDAVPVSVGAGWGVGAAIRATHLAHGGLSLTPIVASRYGYADRGLYGRWDEYAAGFPWSLWEGPLPEATVDRGGWLAGDPMRLLYRWQVYRDLPSSERGESTPWEPVLTRWGRHPPIGREEYGAAVFPPAVRREIRFLDLQRTGRDPSPLQSLSSPKTATLWEAQRTGRELPPDWGILEMDLFFLVVGARVGVRPVEIFDFLAGLVGFDPMGDDDIDLERARPRPVTSAQVSSAPSIEAQGGSPSDSMSGELPAPPETSPVDEASVDALPIPTPSPAQTPPRLPPAPAPTPPRPTQDSPRGTPLFPVEPIELTPLEQPDDEPPLE